MTTPKTILITGANKGLGLGIAQVAATRDPSAHYILTSRNVEAGEKAIQDMKNSGIEASFELLQLDITTDAEILKAAEYVTTKHGKLDGKSIYRRDKNLSLTLVGSLDQQCWDRQIP
jgi:NAD(P)-dependent dehydrogenase (short-subunit alcohol dehydrogenase family)